VLHCPNIIYIPNFTISNGSAPPATTLAGSPGKRILLLANLREQKDHFMLIRVAGRIKETFPDWTFHLVGKDFSDDYAAQVRAAILESGLSDTVFLYGSKSDTESIIACADICLLTSKSEGLPVALLEYGMLEKPVVVTAVGEIPMIVRDGENGLMVKKGDDAAFARALGQLIRDPGLRERMAAALKETVVTHHSEEAALQKYMAWAGSTIYE
jgi:glycosyltransferase involved in cell wall biosynthesis